MKRLKLHLILLFFLTASSLIAVLPTQAQIASPVPALETMCPVNTSLVFVSEVFTLSEGQSREFSYTLAGNSFVTLIRANAAGNPQNFCEYGGLGNDRGRETCDEGQVNETGTYSQNGADVAYNIDPGEDQWRSDDPPVDLGTQNGEQKIQVRLDADGISAIDDVHLKFAICASPAPEITPEVTPEPGETGTPPTPATPVGPNEPPPPAPTRVPPALLRPVLNTDEGPMFCHEPIVATHNGTPSQTMRFVEGRWVVTYAEFTKDGQINAIIHGVRNSNLSERGYVLFGEEQYFFTIINGGGYFDCLFDDLSALQ